MRLIAMLVWALRYLTVAVVVGIGFALLRGGDWLPQGTPPTSAESLAGATRDAQATSDAWQYVVEAGPQGHFVLEAVVDGVPITFLLDTGATDIVLTIADARRLGLNPRSLDFSQRYRTANGEVRGAPVRLRELRVGQFSLYDLDASVNEAPLPISLLGMAFLDQLRGYRVEDRRLILEW